MYTLHTYAAWAVLWVCASLTAALAGCGEAVAAAGVTEVAHGACRVVHVPEGAAPGGSDRYFKLGLALDRAPATDREAQELQYYFNFGFRQNLWLSNGVDSVAPETFFHESAFGLSPYESFFVGFPEGRVPGGRLVLNGPVAADRSVVIDPRPAPPAAPSTATAGVSSAAPNL